MFQGLYPKKQMRELIETNNIFKSNVYCIIVSLGLQSSFNKLSILPYKAWKKAYKISYYDVYAWIIKAYSKKVWDKIIKLNTLQVAIF
jgi:predicted transcriptional regulator